MFSADPVKIKIIQTAGRPISRDEVRSLIQAASYNAKFTFDHKKGAQDHSTPEGVAGEGAQVQVGQEEG